MDEPFNLVEEEIEVECQMDPSNIVQMDFNQIINSNGIVYVDGNYYTSYCSQVDNSTANSTALLASNDRRKQEIVVRSFTPEEGSSQLQDSGISFLSDSISVTSERKTPANIPPSSLYFNRDDVIMCSDENQAGATTPSTAMNINTPDSGFMCSYVVSDEERAKREAYKAEQRARLGRELDKCYLREVHTNLRTPSPNYSAMSESADDGFNVSCYYRSKRQYDDEEIVNSDRLCKDSRQVESRRFRPYVEESYSKLLQRSISSDKYELSRRRDSSFQMTNSSIDVDLRTTGEKTTDHRKRPPHSYLNLIQMALCSRRDLKMTLREIYGWIEKTFPYYRHLNNQGWKNSIRHNLSLYDIFVREKPSSSTSKSSGCSYWTLRRDAVHQNFRSCQDKQSDVDLSDQGGRMRSYKQSSILPSRRGLVPLLPKPNTDSRDLNSHGTNQQHRLSSATVTTAQHSKSVAACSSATSQHTTERTRGGGGILSKRRSNALSCPTPSKRYRDSESCDSTRAHDTTADPVSCVNRSHSSDSTGDNNSLNLSSPACLADVLPIPASPLNSSNESLTLSRSLNTSDLRNQLSFMKFDSFNDIESQNTSVASSSTGGELLRQVSMESNSKSRKNASGKKSSNEFRNIGESALPKPEIITRSRRRKQEFKLLRSPSDARKGARDVDASVSTSSVVLGAERCKAAPESFEPLHDSPPHTPNNTGQHEDEDDMLLTPFRGGAFLESPSLWLSPIRDLGNMTPGVPFTPGEGQWGSGLSTPHEGTRTSTPCGLADSGRAGRRTRRRSHSPRVSAFRILDESSYSTIVRSHSDKNIQSTGAEAGSKNGGVCAYCKRMPGDAGSSEMNAGDMLSCSNSESLITPEVSGEINTCTCKTRKHDKFESVQNTAFSFDSPWKQESSDRFTSLCRGLNDIYSSTDKDSRGGATEIDGLAGLCALADNSPNILNKALLSFDCSPPDISFILQSPVFRRILGEEGATEECGSGVSRVLNF